MGNYSDLTPVNIITGFLGSGKTTLLQRLLRSPQSVRRRRAGQRIRRGRARPSSAARRRREHAADGKRLRVLRGARRSAKGAARSVVPADAGRDPVFSPRRHRDLRLGRSGADRLYAAVRSRPSPSFPAVRDRHDGRRRQRRGATRQLSPNPSNRCRWPTGWW